VLDLALNQVTGAGGFTVETYVFDAVDSDFDLVDAPFNFVAH
jgi:hypothetical protein